MSGAHTGWNMPAGCTEIDLDLNEGYIGYCMYCQAFMESTPQDQGEDLVCADCATGGGVDDWLINRMNYN